MKIALVRPLAHVVAIVLLAGLSACQETTSLTGDWKAPEAGSIKFTKVLVIGLAPMESLRRPVEDAMKAQITAIPAVASYELLPEVADQVDPKKIGEVVKAGGIDGIITMRMVGMQDDVNVSGGGYVPTGYYSFSTYYSPSIALSPYYRGVHGAYGTGYGAMPMTYEYVEPTVTTDVYTSIETNIYEAKEGKLIWSGFTITKNANQRQNTIAEVAAVVKAKLRDQKLIP